MERPTSGPGSVRFPVSFESLDLKENRERGDVMKLEVKEVPISDLKPHPGNPRKHPDKAIDRLVKSIKEYGWTNPILVSQDNYILAGHARLKAAEKAGLEKIPVIYLPLSGDIALAYMIADNKLQDLTEWDFPKLKDLLVEIDTGAFDIEVTGFDQIEIEDLLNYNVTSDRSDRDKRFQDGLKDNRIAVTFFCKNREEYNLILKLLKVESQKQVFDAEVLINALR
jgi:hypothetical protein